MVFVAYDEVVDGKAKVKTCIYKEREYSERMLASGLFVEAVPEPDPSKGLYVLYVNPETKELWYEYTDIPARPVYSNSVKDQMQKQIDDLKLLLAELIAGGTL